MFISKRKIRKRIKQLERSRKNDEGTLNELLKGNDIHIDFGEDMTIQEKIKLYRTYLDSNLYGRIALESLLEK